MVNDLIIRAQCFGILSLGASDPSRLPVKLSSVQLIQNV